MPAGVLSREPQACVVGGWRHLTSPAPPVLSHLSHLFTYLTSPTCFLILPVHLSHLFTGLIYCLIWSLVLPVHVFHLCPCPTCLPILPVYLSHLSQLFTCLSHLTYLPVPFVHLSYLFTHPTCPPVSPVALVYLCTLHLCAGECLVTGCRGDCCPRTGPRCW